MKVSIDTNVWIFGIVGADEFSEKVLLNLSKFRIIIPDQVREELERNLSRSEMNKFYRFVYKSEAEIDFEAVPAEYISEFEQKGLKKGDAEIGAFCMWRKIQIFISDNRDFLNLLSSEEYFKVMSPRIFCKNFL
ncbi:MAG: type II toxin-antitoxin system VapC family toxin [Desulfobacterales bacterium]|nr:type II toxin-antitoxin system VapC family toxin [Desulfobacterales bacterium]